MTGAYVGFAGHRLDDITGDDQLERMELLVSN